MFYQKYRDWEIGHIYTYENLSTGSIFLLADPLDNEDLGNSIFLMKTSKGPMYMNGDLESTTLEYYCDPKLVVMYLGHLPFSMGIVKIEKLKGDLND